MDTAEQKTDKIPMGDLNPDGDDDKFDDQRYKETDFGGTLTEEPDPGVMPSTPKFEPDAFEIGGVRYTPGRLKRMGTDGLKAVFKEITGWDWEILKAKNRKLYDRSELDVEGEGPVKRLVLKFDGKLAYRKIKKTGEWKIYTDFERKGGLKDMQTLLNRAKEQYEKSATKQANDAAGVNLPEEISMDVIRNVLTEMYDDLDLDTEFETVGTQASVNTSSTDVQTDGVTVEEVQAKLETLESVNKTLEKNLRMKEYELNELKARRANDDVVGAKEQEINNLQEKLKETEAERTQLLLDVSVSNELLSEANKNLRELKQKNNEVTEKFNQFKEAATREMKAQREEIINRYWQEQKYDKEQARQEYTEGMVRVKQEFSEQIAKANADKVELQSELVKAQQEIKWLQEAEVKQPQKPDVEDVDLEEREVGGVFAGVMQTVRLINDTIDNMSPDDPVWEKLVDGNLEFLRKQVQHYKQKADNSEGFKKQAYETFQRITEREIDRINLKLDRKLEFEEAKQKLKDEVENNPGVRWERLKKWLKENKWGALSVAFGVGSFIASIIMAVRGAMKTTAKGVSTFGKSVMNVLKKLGPVFAALGSILMSVLGFLGNALIWLSNNLWFLLVLLVMFLWNYGRAKLAVGKKK